MHGFVNPSGALVTNVHFASKNLNRSQEYFLRLESKTVGDIRIFSNRFRVHQFETIVLKIISVVE